MNRLINLLFRRQGGFLLVEAILAVALTALIGLGASMAAAQVCTQTARNADYTTASRQAMNAIAWLGQDAQVAQEISGIDTFPEDDLVFSWTWWDNSEHSATYSLADGELRRTSSSGGEETVSVVAVYIDDDESLTFCSLDDGVLTISITAALNRASVTKSRDIVPRPSL